MQGFVALNRDLDKFTISMFRLILNYTLRAFRRNGFYHLINISGLLIAFTSVFYILIWINQEKSYDRFHPEADRIFRFTIEFQRGEHHTHFARTWQYWTRFLPESFPEIEAMNRIQHMRNARFRIGDHKFNNERFFLTDSIYFEFFGSRLLRGNPATILRDPMTMVLSESMAKKYFAEEDPIGKEVLASHPFDTVYHSYTVTGVMEDPPLNSHFKIDILAPMDFTAEEPGWAYIYLRLSEPGNTSSILDKFPDFLSQYVDEEYIAELTPHLQPIMDIHLRSEKDREIEENNRERSIYIFASIALVFLLIVFVNNANLQIVMLNARRQFIFLNRVNGAGIRHIAMFTGMETVLVYMISVFASALLILLSRPWFADFYKYPLMTVSSGVWMQLAGIALLLTITGVILGLIPVWMLQIRERFYHLDIMRRGRSGRKLLIVLQFSGSLVLVLLTLFSWLQIRYMLTGGIGANQDDLIVLSDLPSKVVREYPEFKNSLMENPLVRDVSASMEKPSDMLMDAMSFEMEGMNEDLEDDFIGVFPVDDNFLDFYDIELITGRDFPVYKGMEARESYILNKSALRILGIEDPEDVIGRPFMLVFGVPDIFHGGNIIGVSEDFNFYTMKQEVKPMVMFQKHIWYWNFLVRINTDDRQASIAYIRDAWEEFFPDFPFGYELVDDLYSELYRNEIIQSKLLGTLSLLTLVIACLGLVGLMRYMAGARTREIGIRKVNGASTFQIVFLLNREFIIMILFSILLGVPLAMFLMQKWLQNFVYRIELNWWIPLMAGFAFLLISILTVTYQSGRAAAGNPVESLRYE